MVCAHPCHNIDISKVSWETQKIKWKAQFIAIWSRQKYDLYGIISDDTYFVDGKNETITN